MKNITDLLTAIVSGNDEKAKEQFSIIMTDKYNKVCDAKKIAIASEIYGGSIKEAKMSDIEKVTGKIKAGRNNIFRYPVDIKDQDSEDRLEIVPVDSNDLNALKNKLINKGLKVTVAPGNKGLIIESTKE